MSILDTIKNALFGHETMPTTKAVSAYDENKSADGLSHHAYIATLEAEREEKDHFLANNPYHSPLAQEDLFNFKGLNYYPPKIEYKYELPLQPLEPESLTFETSTGQAQKYERIGKIEFEIEGQAAQLAIYQSTDGNLFLPYRDATSGKETYGAGRYLEPIPLGKNQLLIDFNQAYNPYCAYSDAYSCPLPPIENWLRIPIRAGEKAYKKH